MNGTSQNIAVFQTESVFTRIVRVNALLLKLVILVFFAGWTGAPIAEPIPERFQLTFEQIEKLVNELPENPSSGVSYLRSETNFRINEDNTYDETHYNLIHVNTEFGLYEVGQPTVVYHPWYENRPTIKARVYNGGDTYDVSEELIQESVLKQQGPVYSETRILHLPVERITVGTVLELEISRTQHRPLFDDGVSLIHNYYPSAETSELFVSFTYPDTTRFRFVRVGPRPQLIEQSTATNDGMKTVILTGTNLSPRTIHFSDRQPNSLSHPFAVLSTGKNWQSVASAYDAIVTDQIKTLDKTVVSTLIDTNKTETEIVRAALTFVNDNIRYISNDLGQSTYTPDAPDAVLSRKYGDCKDQAALLVAMLRASGIQAHIALLSINTVLPPKSPGLGGFDHAVVYVPNDELWIDPTQDSYDIQNIPLSLQGKLALVVDRNTNDLVQIPFSTESDNSLVKRTEVYFRDAGAGRVEEERVIRGAMYETLASNEDRIKDQGRKREKQLLGSIVQETIDIQREDSEARTFHIFDDAKAYRMRPWGYDESVNAEAMLSRLPFYLRQTLRDPTAFSSENTEEDELKHIFIGPRFQLRREYVYHLPDYMTWTELPDDLSLRGSAIDYQRTVETKDNSILVSFEIIVRSNRFPSETIQEESARFSEFRKATRLTLRFRSRGRLMAESGQGKAGVDLLKQWVKKEPDNRMHVVRLVTVLNELGQREASREILKPYANQYIDDAAIANVSGEAWILDPLGFPSLLEEDLVAAQSHYDRALSIDEDYSHSFFSYNGLGQLWFRQWAINQEYPSDPFELAERMDRLIQKHRKMLKSEPALLKGMNNLLGMSETLQRHAARLYLIAGQHEKAKSVLTQAGMNKEFHRRLHVAATAASEGGDAALMDAHRLQVSGTDTLIEQAIVDLAELRKYEASDALASAWKLENPRAGYIATAAPARSCLDAMDEANRSIWEQLNLQRLWALEDYPPEVRRNLTQSSINRFRTSAGAAHAGTELYSLALELDNVACAPMYGVTRVGDLYIVKRSSTTLLFLEVSQSIYYIGGFNARFFAEAADVLKATGHQEELAFLLQNAFKSDSPVVESFRLLEIPRSIRPDEIDFFASLLALLGDRSNARDIENTKLRPEYLQNPYADGFFDLTYARALAKTEPKRAAGFATAAREKLAVFGLRWSYRAVFPTYSIIGDVKSWRAFYEVYKSKFPDDSDFLRFREADLLAAEGRHKELLAKSHEWEKKGDLTESIANHVAWLMFISNYGHQEALALVSQFDEGALRYGATHTKAALLALTDQKAAFDLLKGYRNRSKPPARFAQPSDMMVLAVAAKHLGLDNYSARIVKQHATSNNLDWNRIANSYDLR